MATVLPAGVRTAVDLEAGDRQVYELEGCRISRVDLQDIGLVGYPQASQPKLRQSLHLTYRTRSTLCRVGKFPERSGQQASQFSLALMSLAYRELPRTSGHSLLFLTCGALSSFMFPLMKRSLGQTRPLLKPVANSDFL